MRWRFVLGVAAAIALSASVMMVLPDAYGLLPRVIRDYPVEWSAAVLVILVRAARGFVASRTGNDRAAARVRGWLARLDAGSVRALDRGLAFAVGLLAAAMLASWAPHYLTWPWCRDEDTFATIAQSWDAGIRPYRDIRAYNFPGHIYLHWFLGRAFGWGRTRVFYALDVAALLGLGVALWAWSRRRLGAPLPGAIAYVAFLGFYLGLEYHHVAERDWHATLAAALALMALEAWPARRALWIAGALAAAALTIRPHAVLYLPAMAWAILERPRPLRALAEWGAALALFTTLAFAPLIAQGILDDLIRGLAVAAYGGPYGRANLAGALSVLGRELRQPWTLALVASLMWLSRSGGALRRSAATWLLALLAALIYRALHPVQHEYLWNAPALISAIALAIPTAWIVRFPRLGPELRVLAAVLILYEAVPSAPRFCSARESVRALVPLIRSVDPADPPPGCLHPWFRPHACHYPWPDYCRLLDYLRRETGPETQIANVLKHPPFPSLNGPVGRLSPFHAESGICWMWLVDLDLDAPFAEALERTPDSVVVWVPGEIDEQPRLRLERVTEVIVRHYRPAVRFGRIEVWRRSDSGEVDRTPTPGSPTSSGSRPSAIAPAARR
jgi:hypothetical protein